MAHTLTINPRATSAGRRGPLAARGAGAFWALLLTLAAAPAWAVTPVVLVDVELQAEPVHLQALREDSLSYFDRDRQLRQQSLQRYLRIRDLPGAAQLAGESTAGKGPPFAPYREGGPQAGAAVELVDGQRLPGQWDGADAEGRMLFWRHPLLGRVAIALDQLSEVIFKPGISSQEPADQDQAWLVNGDRLEGFLVGVRPESLEWQPAGSTDTMLIAREQVRHLRLVGGAPPKSVTGHLLWLADGGRLRGTHLALRGEKLTFQPLLAADRQELELPLGQVARIDLDNPGIRLVDLTRVRRRLIAGGVVFGVNMPPRVVGQALRLHAPVTVEFELPPGTQRLAARAQLDQPSGDQAQPVWGDFRILVRDGARQVWHQRLNRRQPTVDINVPISGNRLTIELDPAVDGPVMDRLWLHEAVLLVREP